MGKASFALRWLITFVVVILITLRSFQLSTSQITALFPDSAITYPPSIFSNETTTLTTATTTTTTRRSQQHPSHHQQIDTIKQDILDHSTDIKYSSSNEEEDDEVHPHFTPNVTWDTLLQYSSPLKDKTVPWRRNIRRYWWDLDQNNTSHNNTSSPRPPAMLLLTKYGWNQRNQWRGRTYLRSKRQRALLLGLLEHNWFHPTMWDDVREQRRRVDPSLRYYIFLDLETCADKNYPHYLQLTANQDKLGARGMNGGTDHAKAIQDVLQSPFFTQTHNNNRIDSYVVIWDCNTYTGRYRESQHWRRRQNQDRRLILASLTAHANDILVDHDVGLPPPACNPCHMTPAEVEAIVNAKCDGDDEDNDANTQQPLQHQQQQPYLLSFTGNFRSRTRQALREIHNGDDILIVPPTEAMQYMNETDLTTSFQKMARLSRFSAVPRGDNLFSYRFTEVMSCGSVPVVYADGWVFPYHPVLIEPKEYAVIIPEDKVNQTRAILSRISPGTRCRMRRRGMQLYQQYLKGGSENVRGLIDTLERMRASPPRSQQQPRQPGQ